MPLRTRAAPLALAPLAAVAFACGPPSAPRDAWSQVDLWRAAPEAARTTYATRHQRAIRAVAPAVGAPLVFDLALGASPRLSFRPLARAAEGCRFAVAVGRAGEEDGSRAAAARADESLDAPRASGRREVDARDVAPASDTLPRVVDVDLAEWAGARVELALSATAPSGVPCDAAWGSPVVVDRRARIAARGRGAQLPNVLFLGADTLRADAVGFLGRAPSPTPALDGLAAGSHVFTDAYSSINNTNPSFASLMTGKYVKNHRVFDLKSRLPDAHVTLAEVLRDAGYDTKAIVSVAHLGRAGLRQGFDSFTRPGGQFFAETVVDMAIDWLSEPSPRPFFLWLHFFDPHIPHTPPSPYDEGLHPAAAYGMGPVEAWAEFREPGRVALEPSARGPGGGSAKLYHGEVAYLDRQLDRLLGFLDAAGLLDETLVVFVADHGETLGERLSFFDHVGLYEETTHVPLVVRVPGQREGRVHRGLVQHFDVFPTVLARLGLAAPAQDGIDLLARGAESADAPVRDAVFANHANDRGEMMRTPSFLYLVSRGIPRLPRGPHLYDLGRDPHARDDVAGGGRPEEAQLAGALARWLDQRSAASAPESVPIGDEERRQLEALGYGD